MNETTLWPQGGPLTTDLVVSTIYLKAHPDVVRALVEANVEAIRLCQEQPERARELAGAEIRAEGGPALDPAVLADAWEELTFSWEPLPATFASIAEEAYDVGVLREPPGDVTGVYRLDDLNAVLNDEGLPPVEAAV